MALLQLTDKQLLALVAGVLWPFVRIGAMLVAAPMFGARAVPVRLRIALAFLLAVLVHGQISVPADTDPLSLAGALLVGREVLIGAAMGFLLQMTFGALGMAGEIISLAMGLSFASVVDPDHGGVPLVGQYFTVLAMLLFLALDGHLALIALLVDSFRLLPPAAHGLAADGFWTLGAWAGRMFEAAVLVALPAAAALLVASVSMGLVARSAPQLNIFAVGFPMTLMLGLVALVLALPQLAPQFQHMLGAALDAGRALLGAWQ